jgi:hypothetical protein
MATTMYHTRKNPLKKVTEDSEVVETARSGKMRKAHKAFLRYHHPENWPILRETLVKMGRGDLIGNGERHLVPAWHPSEGAGQDAGARETGARTAGKQPAGLPGGERKQRPGGMPAPKQQLPVVAAGARRKAERAPAAAVAASGVRPSILSTIKAKPKAGRK